MFKKIKRICKSEKHNVFTEAINKIALTSNDETRMQSMNSIETYAYGAIKNVICKKEKLKCNNIMTQ